MRPPTASLPEPAELAHGSLEELFRSSYGGLVAMASVISDDASDAVQEAFVEAYRRWDQIRGYEDPAGWVRRVALNKALDRSRRRGTERRLAPWLLGREAAVSEGSSVDRLDVRAAIRHLPERQRLAVVLRYLGDLSNDEVAAAMGVSAGTVKAALHAARRRLKPFLEVEP